jgi:tripeptide aminopeptidase
MDAPRPTTPGEAAACVAEAIALCEIPAPTGAEEARAREVARRLTVLGLDARGDAAGNVLARVGGDGPALAVAAHLDTVFAGLDEVRVWRDGQLVHGPGIGDNALGLAGLLHLARRLTGAGAGALRRPVLLAATVGEEGLGDLRGARAVIAGGGVQELIAVEGGDLADVVPGGPGSVRVRIACTAPGGHSWADRGAPSAAHALIRLLGEVLAEPGVEAVNVNGLASEGQVNAIAPRAGALLDLRDLDGARLGAARAALERRVAAVAGATGAAIALEVVGDRPGGRLPADHPLLADLLAVRAAAGLPEAEPSLQSTDANAALGAGLPALTIGLARVLGAHTLAEHADVSELATGLDVLAGLVARRAG